MDGILKTCTYRKQLFVCLIFSLLFLTTTAQNAIVTENALPGSPRWLAAELRHTHPKLRDNPHCIAFRKVKADDRKWDWYEPF